MNPVTLFLLRLLARLPLPVLHGIGVPLGWLAAIIPSLNRYVTHRNLELCFPQMELATRRRLGRQSLVEASKTIMETIAIWLGDMERVKGWVHEVRGGELLDQAFAGGKGAIIVSPHIGSWEFAGLYCATHYPMTCLYRPARKKGVAPIIVSGRERMGMRLAPTDIKGVRILLQALKANELVGILPDQDPREQAGAFGPFFGVEAYTMTLLPRLAEKSGAPVLFVFAERLPWGRGFRMHFLPAPDGIDSTDATIAVTALNRGVEQCVELAPAQYQWSYKRFRTRPPGEASLYD